MNKYRLGIDIGSTTVKVVALDDKDQLIYQEYRRHLSDIRNTILSVLKECHKGLGESMVKVNITGSGGLSLSEWLGIDFVQEVIACSNAVEKFIPQTDVVIELGGEDAKITYYGTGMEQRMNGSCAGGTGAFIDQMAVLLDTDASGLNDLAKGHTMIYPIASRCGVFAKTDIQPLINDGARREDIAASIFQAVVNQTIGGLSCGKPIRGKVAFLGGPLFFLSELRERFSESLGLKVGDGICPQNSQLYAAIGAALNIINENTLSMNDLVKKFEQIKDRADDEVKILSPLFNKKDEYKDFLERHDRAKVNRGDLKHYQEIGRAHV